LGSVSDKPRNKLNSDLYFLLYVHDYTCKLYKSKMGFLSSLVTLNIPLQNYSSINRHATIQSQSVCLQFRIVFSVRKWLSKTKNFNNRSDQVNSCYQPEYELTQHLNRWYVIKYNCSSSNRVTSSRRPVNLLLRQILRVIFQLKFHEIL